MSTTEVNQNLVNGVDVGRLENTIDALKAQPDLASFKFRARNQWITGGHNRSTIKDFYGSYCQEWCLGD